MATPYARSVTNDYRAPRTFDALPVREVLAVVLILAGVVGATVAAFAVDWRLGTSVASAAAITAGVFLGYER